jgi:hypothetical protein
LFIYLIVLLERTLRRLDWATKASTTFSERVTNV